LDGVSSGSCAITEDVSGVYSFTASYLGDSNFLASSSGVQPVTVGGAPTVTDNPMSVTAPAGGEVTFFAQAVGTPVPTVVWQVSLNSSGGWTTVLGQRSSRYSLNASAANNGRRYRAEFTNRVRTVATSAATLTLADGKTAEGFWLADSNGSVFAAGSAPALAGHRVPSSDPVVGIGATPDGKGYWLVTANGSVLSSGDARGYGSLPADGVHVSDIVAIAPTGDGGGYWLIGRDGGEFAFGDAHYRGSLPGLRVHVSDIVGMVATSNGNGYWIVGSDGGVFAFGNTHFVGSLPGSRVRVDDVVAMIPSPTRDGYVLVGKDGGAFVYGNGVHYYGSLPGLHIHVTGIVGLALTPDTLGYWFAGSDAATYSFGDGKNIRVSPSVSGDLPVVAIAAS
jgi:hypothetical protein